MLGTGESRGPGSVGALAEAGCEVRIWELPWRGPRTTPRAAPWGREMVRDHWGDWGRRQISWAGFISRAGFSRSKSQARARRTLRSTVALEVENSSAVSSAVQPRR